MLVALKKPINSLIKSTPTQGLLEGLLAKAYLLMEEGRETQRTQTNISREMKRKSNLAMLTINFMPNLQTNSQLITRETLSAH